MASKVKSDRSRATEARPLDFDRLLRDRPGAREQAALAETVAATGEMLRRLRVARGLSERELARRVGSTQAHISELERGLGPNGPTIRTMARIVQELGDELLIDSRTGRSDREARLIADAQSAAAGITRTLAGQVKDRGLAYAVRQLAIGSRTEPSAMTRMLLEGLAIGLYAALDRLPARGPGEVAEAKREIERSFGEAVELTSDVVDVVKSA